MKRFLLVGAVLLAAGCGGDEIPAPKACPKVTDGTVEADVYIDVVEADPSSSEAFELLVDEQDGYVGRQGVPLIPRTEVDWGRGRVLNYRGPAGTPLEVSMRRYTDDFVAEPDPIAFESVPLDRNCDLLIEIRHRGGDDLTMDPRWIERVE